MSMILKHLHPELINYDHGHLTLVSHPNNPMMDIKK